MDIMAIQKEQFVAKDKEIAELRTVSIPPSNASAYEDAEPGTAPGARARMPLVPPVPAQPGAAEAVAAASAVPVPTDETTETIPADAGGSVDSVRRRPGGGDPVPGHKSSYLTEFATKDAAIRNPEPTVVDKERGGDSLARDQRQPAASDEASLNTRASSLPRRDEALAAAAAAADSGTAHAGGAEPVQVPAGGVPRGNAVEIANFATLSSSSAARSPLSASTIAPTSRQIGRAHV